VQAERELEVAEMVRASALTGITNRAMDASRSTLRPMPRFAVLVCLSLLGACGGGDGGDKAVERKELEHVVLQPADVPAVFERFDVGRLLRTDQAGGGERADPARFGRQEGWKARYKRSGTQETRGPLVIESRVDLFDDEGGAEQELAAHREELERGVSRETATESLEDPTLGDEAFAKTFLQPGAMRDVRFYMVVWREANVTAGVVVNGFEGNLTLAQTLGLARKQQLRIARAAESG
jgi:hypothetical protein